MTVNRTPPPAAGLAVQVAEVTAELARLREAVLCAGHLIEYGRAIEREENGHPGMRRPSPRRDRHGMRAVSAGES